MKRRFLLPVVLGAAVLCSFTGKKPAPNRPPNVIVILADDLGYSDLQAYGNKKVRTPNIDGLGKSGVRFTTAYAAAPICSPSRAGLITGRSQVRFGYEFMPDGSGANQNGLPASELTLAQLLHAQGYATGVVGKWHLGTGDGFYPDQKGFDYSYYFQAGLSPYTEGELDTSKYVGIRAPWALTDKIAWMPRKGATAIREGREVVKDTGYLTFSLADKASQFIQAHKDKPYFLYLTFNAPHDPFQVPKAYYNRITTEKDSLKRIYYGMIEALDDAVGQVLAQVKASGEEDNTIIFFTSDNGGASYTRATDNYPLRGGKCTHFEGGVSVPFFVRYPGHIASGVTSAQEITSLDIFATAAALANAALPADRTYDGVNLVPFLQKGSLSKHPHDTFVWRSGFSKAYRSGNWKLVVNEHDKKEWLFDLSKDREEKNDLSGSHPKELKELKEALKKYEETQVHIPLWESRYNTTVSERGEEYTFPI